MLFELQKMSIVKYLLKFHPKKLARMNIEIKQQEIFGEFKELQTEYQIQAAIGSGSFGEVYKAICTKNNTHVAIKVEKNSSGKCYSLRRESKILQKFINIKGFPEIKFFSQSKNRSILIMDLLGFSLEKLFVMCNQRFSLKTVLLLFDQMLKRLEIFHKKGYIHRDIKPENWLIGKSNKDLHTVHLIDFGMSKTFKNSKNYHLPNLSNKGMVGTARYCSINSHHGNELSRRDDLISLGYMMIYFLKGKLPWQNLDLPDQREKFNVTMEMKNNLTPAQLCENLPHEFTLFMCMAYNLNFYEEPDYKKIRKIFKELFIKCNFENDQRYDWCSHHKILKIIPTHISANENHRLPKKNKEYDYQKEEMTEGSNKIMLLPMMNKILEEGLIKPGEFMKFNKSKCVELNSINIMKINKPTASNKFIIRQEPSSCHNVSHTRVNIGSGLFQSFTKVESELSEKQQIFSMANLNLEKNIHNKKYLSQYYVSGIDPEENFTDYYLQEFINGELSLTQQMSLINRKNVKTEREKQ